MQDIDSPTALAERLVGLFPSFAEELADVQIEGYHQVLHLLTPVITGYLAGSPDRTIAFCELINFMADAGGERENAIATCLLEHASQVKLRKIIRPHLGPAARKELR